MNILWVTTFKSFKRIKKNDDIQYNFLKSLDRHKKYINLCVTIFNEKNIRTSLKKFKLKKIYFKNKKKLPHNSKYSQSICMQNALKILNKKKYDYLVWSTADILIPTNFVSQVKKLNFKRSIYTIFPMYHFYNYNLKKFNKFPSNFGLDIFIIKYEKNYYNKLKSAFKITKNYGWGCYEHFLSSLHNYLNIEYINLFKKIKIYKYNNDKIKFKETIENEKKTWKRNQKYLLKFLNQKKLSNLYATGSMYYLLFKLFRIQDQNLTTIICHLLIIYKLLRKIFHLLIKTHKYEL